jgi:hypothetical protein
MPASDHRAGYKYPGSYELVFEGLCLGDGIARRQGKSRRRDRGQGENVSPIHDVLLADWQRGIAVEQVGFAASLNPGRALVNGIKPIQPRYLAGTVARYRRIFSIQI